VATFAGSLVLLPLFFRRSLTHPRPLLDMTLFRIRTYAYGTAALAALRFAVFGFYVLLPVFFTEVMGYSTWKTGLAMVPNPVFGTLLAIPFGRLTDRVGPRVMATTAGVLWIIGLLWWSTFLSPDHTYLVGYMPGAFFWGAGMGIAQTSITAGSLRDLAGPRFGLASATQNTIGQLAASLGLAFAIAVLGDAGGAAAVHEFHRTYRVLAAGSLVTIWLCWRGLPGPIRDPDDDAAARGRPASLAVEP
jgi:MFS family permease